MDLHKKLLSTTAIALGLVVVISGSAAQAADMTSTSATPDPYEKVNQTDITISGDVIYQSGDTFTLDYGDGLITVEMDDWDWHNEAAQINAGETVTVRGEIDKDFYEAKTIEADSVYVADRATFYYASDIDEEDSAYWTYTLQNPKNAPDGTWFSLTGTIEEVEGREFVLDTGMNKVTVETATLDYNPLDDTGYQQLDIGDRVYVAGMMDLAFFEEAEIEAMSVVTLSQDKTKVTGQ